MANWPQALLFAFALVAAALAESGVAPLEKEGALDEHTTGAANSRGAVKAVWPPRRKGVSDGYISRGGPQEAAQQGINYESLADMLWKDAGASVPIRSLLDDSASGEYGTLGTSGDVFSGLVVTDSYAGLNDNYNNYYGYYGYEEYDQDDYSMTGSEVPDVTHVPEAPSDKTQMPPCPGIGFEYTHMVIMAADPAKSTIECEARCLSYPGACEAWAWVDPRRAVNRSDLGTCYLNYEANALEMKFLDNGIWIGNPACSAIDSDAADAVYLDWVCPGSGYEYIGGDYITLRSLTPRGCQDHCRREPHCESWSWYENRDLLCNLKNGYFSLVASKACSYAGTRSCHYRHPQGDPP